MAFDTRTGRDVLPDEVSFFPIDGGQIVMSLEGDGLLALTLIDRELGGASRVVLTREQMGELHLWLTATLTARLLGAELPEGPDLGDLAEGEQLLVQFDDQQEPAPLAVQVADYRGARAYVLLTGEEALYLYPGLTALVMMSNIER